MAGLVCKRIAKIVPNLSGQQQVRHFKQVGNKKKTKYIKTVKDVGQPQKKSLEHLEVQPEITGHVPFSRLIKPFGFACVFTACSFGGATIWQYEGMRSKALQQFAENFRGYFHTPKRGKWREQVQQSYNRLNETQKITLGIIAANVAVCACWRIPSLQPIMLRWFTASPAAKAVCFPMLLSSFSHAAIWHLGINMYVLWSFTRNLDHTLGKEQFLAFYLSAGVWSSFASNLLKVATARYNVSLGASGAIMAVLGAFCMQYPDARLAIVFLPFFTFSAGMGLKALLAVETTGVVLGWQFFDHAAHLSGLLFGGYYMINGHKHLWDKRESWMKTWDHWRGKPKDV